MNNTYNDKNLNKEGVKDDASKPDLSLVLCGFSRALQEVGKVGTKGALKYTPNGWSQVRKGKERYTSALLRHLLLENEELLDKELDLSHSACVAWNALARLELILRDKTNESI